MSPLRFILAVWTEQRFRRAVHCGGFDFWPVSECVLDVDSFPIVPFV